MANDNRENEDIIVAFNGKNHKLKDWTRKEKAATDDDPSLNWRKVFEEHTPKPNVSESAPTGFVPYKKVKKKRRLKSAKTPLTLLIKQFWIPFLSAIIVGLGIGFTVLIMFSNHKAADKPTVPATAQPSEETNTTDNVAQSLNGKDFAITLQMIQGGSFDTIKGAKDGLTKLKNDGIPGAIFTEGKTYKVMIGVANDEATRRELQDTLGDIDLYGKLWDFGPKTIKASKNVGEFLKAGKNFVESMVPMSAAKELNKKIDNKSLAKISDEMGTWSSIDQLNVKGTLKSDLTSFRGAVEAALSHLENGDSPKDGQQSLLDALSIYQKIVSALSE